MADLEIGRCLQNFDGNRVRGDSIYRIPDDNVEKIGAGGGKGDFGGGCVFAVILRELNWCGKSIVCMPSVKERGVIGIFGDNGKLCSFAGNDCRRGRGSRCDFWNWENRCG